ncbi:ABC transporter permease [Aliicoccus persicus]|uniref:Putative hemin transport system permease protein HrtB n=1 Tax=Aliicoccus persicus TaxID=930138 RepID=A0A662Z255_9STAP|nr:ABC transporter permease [Aliicoccus persicus]SEV93091.1 putative ABC transport system permease protein [Aliicoccus persicus]
MKIAIQEILKNKLRYSILGIIILLIAFLTLAISGLARGLSYDNASLILDMPEGTFYMEEAAEDKHNFSAISDVQINNLNDAHDNMTLMSIQMGEVEDSSGQAHSLVFVTSEGHEIFPKAAQNELLLDGSLQDEGIQSGEEVSTRLISDNLTVSGFTEQQTYSHSPAAFIHPNDFSELVQSDASQIVFVEDEAAAIDGLTAYSNDEFLNTLPSFSSEQMSLNMITYFLYAISGLLFAIFFYMINVQKLTTFGILKAVGVKTITLFKMMWTQMILITIIALGIAVGISQLLVMVMPDAIPFQLTWEVTLFTSAVFMIIGFIGATLSGIQISKVEPMYAINQGGA